MAEQQADPALQEKQARLKEILRDLGSVLVAFSGGVDSVLLLSVAREVLGDQVVAATARSLLFPAEETERATRIAAELGVRQVLLEMPLDLPELVANSPRRCYYCKAHLFQELRKLAGELGLRHVVHGEQLDDAGDFRPGARAAAEFGIRAPLAEAGLTKADVRQLSRRRGLPTWDLPGMACYASRIPYGVPLTEEKLRQVAAAEVFLTELGLAPLRVRHHGDTARIEIDPEQFARLLTAELRESIVERLRQLGFVYVTLDLQGLRSGSMNEPLHAEQRSD